MDYSYMQVLQLVLLLLLIYAASHLILPQIKTRYIVPIVLVNHISNLYFFHFDIHLDRCDFESFEKYDIWRYIQKKRENSILI